MLSAWQEHEGMKREHEGLRVFGPTADNGSGFLWRRRPERATCRECQAVGLLLCMPNITCADEGFMGEVSVVFLASVYHRALRRKVAACSGSLSLALSVRVASRPRWRFPPPRGRNRQPSV